MEENDNRPETITSYLANNPKATPEEAAKELFYKHKRRIKSHLKKRKIKKRLSSKRGGDDVTLEDMDAAAEFGGYTERPSDLFLKVLSDVIQTLSSDPLVGLVSPSLLATTGVIPLTVISTIPDIMKHYHECIVNAKIEVLLATNYWEKSRSVDTIVSAIRELDKRAGADGRKVVLKIMIDHPTARNLIHSHSKMTEKEWVEHGLPALNDIPNLTMEMVNYHRMPLGTFHSKFMVVDRRIALLNSNNIQDRPNLEMMSHYEGRIVNSLYDTFLISWWLPFDTPLACCGDEFEAGDGPFNFGNNDPLMLYIKQRFGEIVARARVRLMMQNNSDPVVSDKNAHIDVVGDKNTYVNNSHGDGDDSHDDFDNSYGDGDGDENRSDYDWEDRNNLDKFSETYRSLSTRKQPEKDESEVRKEGRSFQDVVLQVMNQKREKEEADTPKTDEGKQQSNPDPESQTETPGNPLTDRFNKVAKVPVQHSPDLDPKVLETLCLDFVPYKFHSPHAPFPIALVNRSPYQLPGHTSLVQPQNAAWLGLMKYAKRDIFIQTPTFNASPAIKAVLAACQRGILVTIFVDYGFNDTPESSPFQGGPNAKVIKSLYASLQQYGNGVENNLKVYWYTGKDQIRPFHAAKKQRNCHVKFLSVDGQVAVMGNGNMDTQSWFHSQEINAMVDSPQLIQDWIEALYKNQSTEQFGMVDKNGAWIGDKKQLKEKKC